MKKKIFLLLLAVLVYQAGAQIARGQEKFLGCNFRRVPYNSDWEVFWNQGTPGNAGKWQKTEPVRDSMFWDGLDSMLLFCENNNFPMKEHTFIWGNQEPPWASDSTITEQEMKEEVEEWIRLFCERYDGDIEMIDVVNEPLHDPPSYKKAIGGSNDLYGTGWDWVVWAFEKSREYCPNAKLLLNDYDILKSGNATNRYLKIINILKDRNLIDGIGLQAHFLESADIATIESNLNSLAATGLDVYISELDVNIYNDADQKSRYEALFPLFWEHPSVKGVTLWGYKQGDIWRGKAYLIRTDGSERPAMQWLRNYIAGYADPRFEAELHNEANGIGTYGSYIGDSGDNGWARYSNVNFGEGYDGFKVKYANGNTGNGFVELRSDSLNGPLLATLHTTHTGGWDVYNLDSVGINNSVTGIHDVYLVFKREGSVGNIDWFELQNHFADTTIINNNGNSERMEVPGLSIYSGPADDFITIKNSHNISSAHVVNMQGKSVLRQAGNSNHVRMNSDGLKNGTYIVVVQTQSELLRKKMLIKR